ncbi:mechanosensitive ion channel family protein [Chitinophaga lutea]
MLQDQFWGNSVQSWMIAALIFCTGILLVRLFRKVLLRRLQRLAAGTEQAADDFIVYEMQRSVVPLLYYGIFFLSLHYLQLHPKAARVIDVASLLYLTFVCVRLFTDLLRFLLERYLSKQERGEEKRKQVRGVMIIVSVVIWIMGIVFLLDNWGFDVTSIITGLGIGGIAIALATQHILGDLFSYFVILFDRPFEVGDFIIVQDKIGTVEYIGIKTTRVRAITGEQLICSNTDLTNSRIHNYKRMERRRIAFRIGIKYDTPAEKLRRVGSMMKDIVSRVEGIVFDRAHLASFGDFSIVYECVFFVGSSDYMAYMNAQEEINLRLYERFEKEGIGLAHLRQSMFINK